MAYHHLANRAGHDGVESQGIAETSMATYSMYRIQRAGWYKPWNHGDRTEPDDNPPAVEEMILCIARMWALNCHAK